MELTIPDIIGFMGVGSLVAAYFMISSGRVNGESIKYHGLNILGSMLLLISLYYKFNVSAVAIQIIWITIGSYGIWRSLRKRSTKPEA